jgi:hypothetical protein
MEWSIHFGQVTVVVARSDCWRTGSRLKRSAMYRGAPAVIARAPGKVQDGWAVRINRFSRTSTLMF